MSRQECRRPLGSRRSFSMSRNCGSTTVSSTTCTWETARPAHQGLRPPYHGATGESLWFAEQCGPWRSATASRQGSNGHRSTISRLPTPFSLPSTPATPSKNPLWDFWAPPWTHEIDYLSIFCTGLKGPRWRGSTRPKVADK